MKFEKFQFITLESEITFIRSQNRLINFAKYLNHC